MTIAEVGMRTLARDNESEGVEGKRRGCGIIVAEQ